MQAREERENCRTRVKRVENYHTLCFLRLLLPYVEVARASRAKPTRTWKQNLPEI